MAEDAEDESAARALLDFLLASGAARPVEVAPVIPLRRAAHEALATERPSEVVCAGGSPMTPVVHRTVLLDPSKLSAAPYNPRRISRRAMSALKASITAHGFVEPVVVQSAGMVLIGGHQRVEALRQLCAEAGGKPPKIPAVVLDIGDREAKLLNVALNRIGGEFDDTALSSLLAGLGTLDDAAVLATGLTEREVATLLAPPEPLPGAEPTTAFARSVTLTVRFDTVEERDAAKALLDERAQRAGKKPGVVLRELLA